ncbi:unnamed protein product [Adineta steineri]|uniref:ABM domain-containing protein n=1 Tax=Adineta steineri TaxID=433720 RepID=A0A819PKC4_9BILA|nr:unnamed protein product [Adineta steineri]
MSFLLHVEFDATSESTATKILECLSGMADIVHRDYPEVYTYVFRYANESKRKLIFTEIYANEQVFLDHGRDPEFGKFLQIGFNPTTGKSRKELCIRNDMNTPLSQLTASILDNYLHVTYIPVQQGFFHRNFNEKSEMNLLILCRGCDEDVSEQLNTLVNCVTSITFEESDGNRQLIAVITNISNEKQSIKDKKSLIDTIEIVCSNEEIIRKFKNIIENYFQIQSIHIQTSFSGYIRHKSFL